MYGTCVYSSDVSSKLDELPMNKSTDRWRGSARSSTLFDLLRRFASAHLDSVVPRTLLWVPRVLWVAGVVEYDLLLAVEFLAGSVPQQVPLDLKAVGSQQESACIVWRFQRAFHLLHAIPSRRKYLKDIHKSRNWDRFALLRLKPSADFCVSCGNLNVFLQN